MATPLQVADGVHRIADGLVNWYLIEADDGVTIVDTGWLRTWPRHLDAVTAIGRMVADVRAVLLTHGHPDHQGSAEKIRRGLGTPVHAHRDEIAYLRGEAPQSSPFTLVPGLLPTLWRPSAFGFVLHAAVHGFMTPTWVSEIQPLDDGQQVDVPGSPQVVATPGHTSGHVCYHLPDRGVLFAGDALVSLNVLTGERGPRLLPAALNSDTDRARASLDRLKQLDADIVLPGHGDPLRAKVAELVGEAASRS